MRVRPYTIATRWRRSGAPWQNGYNKSGAEGSSGRWEVAGPLGYHREQVPSDPATLATLAKLAMSVGRLRLLPYAARACHPCQPPIAGKGARPLGEADTHAQSN